MAVLLEMPLQHPSRRTNPFGLTPKPQAGLKCPFGCEGIFENHGLLYIHLLVHDPERREIAKQP
jgi:hypothetical protein